jgi:salicylate hydroxylase
MTRILIVGAGIGGLSAALALQRIGLRPLVLERAPALGEVGAGLTVGPNMMHGLDWLGVARAARELGCIPRHGGVLDVVTGELLVANDRGDAPERRYGQPYLQIHRADLHSVLARAVLANDPAALRLGHELTGLGEEGGVVRARFADGGVVEGDLVVGADGTRSAVREALFPGREPRFTGYVAWRGLVPRERLAGLELHPDSAIMVAHGRSFARYAVAGGRLLNYVAWVERAGWTEEGWSIPSTVDELMANFADAAPVVGRIVRETLPGECFKWGLFDREPLPAWTSGRVTLLGDAAHPMLPFLGQGAAMAVEDAVILARTMAAAGPGTAALASYEAARRERTALVMRASRDAVRAFHAAGPYVRGRHRDAEALGLFAFNPATTPLPQAPVAAAGASPCP